MPDQVREVIDRAAHIQGRSRSDFMIDAARRAAEEALRDQTLFVLEPEAFAAFVKALDAPPKDNPALRKVMRTPPPWDEG
jgi:uncharacterized protein (DUF1778 family)